MVKDPAGKTWANNPFACLIMDVAEQLSVASVDANLCFIPEDDEFVLSWYSVDGGLVSLCAFTNENEQGCQISTVKNGHMGPGSYFTNLEEFTAFLPGFTNRAFAWL